MWDTIEKFRQKIIKLEMAKQQHKISIHNDAQNAANVVRIYQKSLHSESQQQQRPDKSYVANLN